MSVETLIGAAAEAACAALDGLRCLQSLPDESYLVTRFANLVSLYVYFSPINRQLYFPIQKALPFLRGVRTSKGVRFSSCRANCYHEILLKMVQGHHRWLGRHAVFQPLAVYLQSKCLGLFRNSTAWWQLAVERFVLVRCADENTREWGAHLAEGPMYQEPRFAECEAIYRQLLGEEKFDGRTFTEAVQVSSPAAYYRLGEELGERARAQDLDELQRHIEWETSRALLVNREELLGGELGRRIRPEDRTRPMTLLEAARLMGYCRVRSEKDGVKALRAAVDAGTVAYERLTRKQHIFSRKDFDQKVWPKIAPIGPN